MKTCSCALLCVLGLCSILGCLTGCQSAGPQDFDDALLLVDRARAVAQEQGVAWTASIRSSGSPEVYERASFGIDSGIVLDLKFQGNAQTATGEPNIETDTDTDTSGDADADTDTEEPTEED